MPQLRFYFECIGPGLEFKLSILCQPGPDQKDSDSLPDYNILDEILELYIEHHKGPKEIVAAGHDPALVKRILKMVNINEFKRYQTAPTLRVSPKAFGMGRRMPIVAKYLS